jgi:hypothetical protein
VETTFVLIDPAIAADVIIGTTPPERDPCVHATRV